MNLIYDLSFKRMVKHLDMLTKLYLKHDNDSEWIFDKVGTYSYLMLLVNHKRHTVQEFIVTQDELKRQVEKIDITNIMFKSPFDNVVPFRRVK